MPDGFSIKKYIQDSGLGAGSSFYSREIDEYVGFPFIAHIVQHGFSNVFRKTWFCKKSVDFKSLTRAPFELVIRSTQEDFPRDARTSEKQCEWIFLLYKTINEVAIPIHLQIKSSSIAFMMAYKEVDLGLKKEIEDKLLEIFPIDVEGEPDSIPVAFWVLGSDGPYSTSRDIDAGKYEQIRMNYESKTINFLDKLNSFVPTRGGQMLLFSGIPGTGKTYALRSLFQSWRSWANFHYIVDPLTLFGGSPEYLMKIILGAATGGKRYSPWVDDDDDDDDNKEEKWRVLLMEDVGELISSSAKEEVGQGLSQLLNVTDGLLGQGLKILLLMTTNEKLGDLHPAICRPGRCAYHHEFGKLSPKECKAWLSVHKAEEKFDDKFHTIAELYAMVHNDTNQGQFGESKKKPMGFMPG